MELRRQRENQRWILDYVVWQTGKAHNFEYEGRSYPPDVKRYEMIPKLMARIATHQEGVATRAAEAGHRETAARIFYRAAMAYRTAQHAIRRDGDRRKLYLYERLLHCYDRVIEYNAYPIEKVEVPFGGASLAALFHVLPDRRRAPCIIFLPGMDMTKESCPVPFHNHFARRGMHVLTLDGPGVGLSNLRKIHVTDDNFELAVQAAVDYLLQRPEVDGRRIGVCGVSMGSFWGARAAAFEKRLAACAVCESCFGDKHDIFDRAPPDFKEQFMYMSGIADEAEFDRMAERMTTVGYGSRIQCPTLIAAGEFDPLCGIEATQQFFDEIAGPKELWVVEDEFHFRTNDTLPGFGDLNFMPFVADWLNAAFAGRHGGGHRRVVYIPRSSAEGPYGGRDHPGWYR